MATKRGKVFVVSGPSAAGKTTVVTEALRRLSETYPISRVVTYTSRPPRREEESGKDYVFLSGDAFDFKERDGFFLETTSYVGHRMGSPRIDESELDLGKSFVYVVDLEGAKAVVKAYRDACTIWIEAPDMETLKARLKKRGCVDSDFEKRVALAEEEMKEAHKIRLFEYVLVNEDFEQAVNELILLVAKALQ